MVEFNTGFVTALALFYGHMAQWQDAKLPINHDLRIYGAADHLFDMEVPKSISQQLRKDINKFRDDVLRGRLDRLSQADAEKFFERCYKLIMRIDEEVFKLKVEVTYS